MKRDHRRLIFPAIALPAMPPCLLRSKCLHGTLQIYGPASVHSSGGGVIRQLLLRVLYLAGAGAFVLAVGVETWVSSTGSGSCLSISL